ncbi:MAG: hypothetical protein EAZ47_04445 [Bacteroidetes bacterium]|nr:MAG: hypothetical protein EAY72_02780 [Bacteroidota bacterium]TAE69628.1 MAG: hypothetical protein EAY68_03435 [Bacteroidota bacterium]TAF94153.1 MAG: hypothetical protein EAZ47_04445 [Bacteroidota bacterium]
MKHFLSSVFLFVISIYICNAQSGNTDRQNKIEALKIAFISKELNLTPDEAQRFWPVYNSYSTELKQHRKDHLQDELAFEEKALEVRKRFKLDFKKVLNDDARVNRIYTMERNFKDALKKELEQRQQLRKMNGGERQAPRMREKF